MRKNLRHLQNLRDQTPVQIGLQEKKIPKDYLLCLSLQKKCIFLLISKAILQESETSSYIIHSTINLY